MQRNLLRIEDTQRALLALRLLGYETLGSQEVIDTHGLPVPALLLFHYFTDPNQRLCALLDAAQEVLDNLLRCVDEDDGGREAVRAWKEGV